MSALPWLDPYNDDQPFPNPEYALTDPDGLLAVGGNLSPKRLLRAYRHGIFPWYSEGQPILWWSPDPRTVLFPERIKISRSLRKTMRKEIFTVTLDHAFEQVIQRCSEPRRGETGTWLTPEMKTAYIRLHQMGYAHSAEVWSDNRLVGGLYGIAIGRIFFGESMFSHITDASKAALVHLCAQLQTWDYVLIDCQMHTAHLIRMGAADIPRQQFLKFLEHFCPISGRSGSWADVQYNGTLSIVDHKV
jgi:leucyl/phenylalanyl-tRNA--protein transferase